MHFAILAEGSRWARHTLPGVIGVEGAWMANRQASGRGFFGEFCLSQLGPEMEISNSWWVYFMENPMKLDELGVPR